MILFPASFLAWLAWSAFYRSVFLSQLADGDAECSPRVSRSAAVRQRPVIASAAFCSIKLLASVLPAASARGIAAFTRFADRSGV